MCRQETNVMNSENSNNFGGITMFRRIASMTGWIPLAVLGWLLAASPAAAQNQGYSVWAHRNDGGGGSWSSGGGGWRSRSFFVPPSSGYYNYAPAYTASAPVTQSQAYYYYSAPVFAASAPVTRSPSYDYGSYYAPGEASPVNGTVTINATVPADAKIWFDGSKTVQTGRQRQFVSPPLQPGREYTYDVQVKWKQGGREVTRERRISVHAGDVVNLTFPVE
jgi:uncharacterized protein (TIGR03000 family)